MLKCDNRAIISIHALLAESDTGAKLHDPGKILFLSTLSLRRATLHEALHRGWLLPFLSTLSLRRATTSVLPTIPAPAISIHALLAESDVRKRPLPWPATHFYPRSPCGERPSRLHKNFSGLGFLSTLSLRRATYGRINDISRLIFLSTLSLRRATQSDARRFQSVHISIHALLAESDHRNACCLGRHQISIHALLAESDGGSGVGSWPRAIFLSTLSLRRATILGYKIMEVI